MIKLRLIYLAAGLIYGAKYPRGDNPRIERALQLARRHLRGGYAQDARYQLGLALDALA